MALLVDKPKQGFGSTNDGNTARRFFQNPQKSSEITGVDLNLIHNFAIILRVLSSGYHINVSEFEHLLTQTRELYLQLYSWYYMPSSVHKVLVHGVAVIQFFNFPIGELSEEALEARHKEIKRMRLTRTRKTSRFNTNTDLLNLLILSSDPHLSSLRNVTNTQHYTIDDDIKKFLVIDNDT